MKIEKLHLKNFRNYDELLISFNDKLNFIIGNNAQGKTNILEAIYYLSITKSFLSINDKCIIKKDNLFMQISGKIDTTNGKKKLAINFNENGKKIEINDKEIKKHGEYVGNFKTIIFSPDNIRLIKEGPGNRRRFLNIEISQLHGKYINILNEFNVILKQRNEYLKIIKTGRYNQEYLDILNDKFITLSVLIYKYRNDFISKLNLYIGKIFEDISGYKGLSLKYITNVDIQDEDSLKDKLMLKLNNQLEREIIYGSTMIGPHRDDFIFCLDDTDLLAYGSQGQLKMAILALKLAEIDVFYEICGEYPVLLLDDLFSELDVEKRNKVISYLDRDIQTIVTTTDLDNIDTDNINNSYINKIENGVVIYKNYD